MPRSCRGRHAAFAVFLFATRPLFAAGDWTLQSLSNLPPDAFGVQCNDACTIGRNSIGAGGDVVVFSSLADNLVEDDRNGSADVYLRRTGTNTTLRLTPGTSTDKLGGGGYSPQVSIDGRRVAFLSQATDLVAGDNNSSQDVFVVDVATGAIEAASVRNDGAFGGFGGSLDHDLASDGSAVAFASFGALVDGGGAGRSHVYLRDLDADTLELVSVRHGADPNAGGDGSSEAPRISDNARHVAFHSFAKNLLATPVTVGATYLRDRVSDTTAALAFDTVSETTAVVGFAGTYVVVRAAAGATQGPARDDLCGFHRIEIATLQATPIPVATSAERDGPCSGFDVSDDGTRVLFSTRTRIVPEHGVDRAELYVVDATSGSVTLVSQGAYLPLFSKEGGFLPQSHAVAFTSESALLVAGDTNRARDGFVRRADGAIARVTLGGPVARPAGAHGASVRDMSADGRFVLYGTGTAPFAAPGEAAAGATVLLDRQTGARRIVNRVMDAIVTAQREQVSDDGQVVVFLGAQGGSAQVYRWRAEDGFATPVLAPPASGRREIAAMALAASGNAIALHYNDVPPDGEIDEVGYQIAYASLTDGSIDPIAPAQELDALHLSDDGEVTAFATTAALLPADATRDDPDVYRWRRSDASLVLLPGFEGVPGQGYSYRLAASRNGRYLTWMIGPDAGAPSSRVVHDTEDDSRVVLPLVAPLTASAQAFDVSNDGQWMTFTAFPPSGTPTANPFGERELYVYSTAERTSEIVSRYDDGRASGGRNSTPLISQDGSIVVFGAGAPFMAADDREPNAFEVVAASRPPVGPLLSDGFE